MREDGGPVPGCAGFPSAFGARVVASSCRRVVERKIPEFAEKCGCDLYLGGHEHRSDWAVG